MRPEGASLSSIAKKFLHSKRSLLHTAPMHDECLSRMFPALANSVIIEHSCTIATNQIDNL